MTLSIQYDFAPLARLSNALQAAGKQMPLVMVRAINHTGDKAVTQVRNVLVKQTGLKRGTMVRAVRGTKAFNGKPYVIRSRGGDVRLQFFSARETRKGVTAAPWNSRRLFARTFIKGGKFPDRKPLNLGGAVLKRVGKGRYPLTTVKSGLFIPEEMVTGDSEQAFFATVDRDLPTRIEHELYRVLGGA
ncbi:phage tail protein [Nitrobacter sp.]|uniref:phage tail protein n=1 Tax=Nitrobacter sp. TaxID=29420 RepID=UPI003F64B1E4